MANEILPESRFKVGDMVQVLRCPEHTETTPVGSVGTIVKYQGLDDILVEFPDGQDWYYEASELRPVPLPAPPAPPPDVAAPGDRLFDGVGVCCLCGVDGAHHVRGSDCPIPGARYCNRRPCLSASYSIRKIDAEITRRRALQTPPAPEKWEPKVGEMCEGDRMGDLIRGPYRRNDVDGWPILLMQEGPPGMHLYVPIEQRVKPGSLRPAPPSQSATAPKGEGERKGAYANDGLRPAEHDMAACTVPMNDMRRDERISALSTGDELSQLAARRQRQRGALLEAMDDGKARREAVRHPSDWDVSDAPECYSTHGSGR